MKTFLRNVNSGRYFHGVDVWSNEREQAFDFRTIERAVRFARDARLKMHELEAVLAFDDPGFNVIMAIIQGSDMHRMGENRAANRA